MKTKFTMMMAVIATFAISLNLHSSNEEVVFGAPAVQMPRGGEKYCALRTIGQTVNGHRRHSVYQ